MAAPAPAAFRELVLSRSAALHRTALLLARDEQDARELLEEALARASRTWDRSEGQPEAYCRSVLARVATSVGRRRRHTGASSTDSATTDSASTPADAMRALPPRQRAVIVLLHFHHYTPEQTADALDTTLSAVEAHESAALSAFDHRGLAGTLDAIADAGHSPDATALLAGAVSRARQIGRRRRLGWAVAAVAVVALSGAGVVLDDSPDDSEQVQDEEALEDLAVPDPAYDEGYGFQDGTPRPFTLDGLELVVSHEIAPGGLWSTGFPPTSPDNPLYAVVWCPSVDAAEARAEAGSWVTMTADDAVTLALPCTPTTDQQSVPAQPLPVDAGLWRVDNPLSSGALVAVYQEAVWQDFPFTPPGHRMAWSPPPSTEDSVVIDATTPERPRPDLDVVAGTSPAYTATVPLPDSATIDLDVLLDGPGQVLVALDGVVVTEDGDGLGAAVGSGPLESAEPDLRRGFVHNFEPGVRRRTISLNGLALFGMGVDVSDGEVEVSVVPAAVRPEAWAVQISTDDSTSVAEAVLEPVPDETFATYAFGLRQIGAIDVPADGRARQVAIDPRGTGPLVWASECPPDQPGEEESIVLTVGVTEQLLSCALGDAWSSAVRTLSDDADQPPPGRPAIAVDALGQRDSVRVAAYEPVPWGDYPFDSSTVAPDLQGLPQPGQSTSSGNDGLTNVYVETDVVTLDDLDAQGRAVLALEPAQFTDLVIRTTGVGRFRLKVTGAERAEVGLSDLSELPYGEVLERNGWWSSWTAEPSTWRVPALSREDDRPAQELGGQITVTVEGYEEGSLEIAAISLLPALGD